MEFSHHLYDGGEHGSAYESLYSCADCGKLYMHKRTLKRHELVHSSSSCFTCLVCGKQYSQQYDLERHSRCHRGDKPFKCYVCARPFAMSHHLNNHMVTHTGVRAYSCLVCNKRFAQTFSLKRHMRMHLRAAESVAGDGSTAPADSASCAGFSVGGMALLQSLSCHICGKIFSSQQTLKRHRCELSSNAAAAVAGNPRRPLASSSVTLVRHRTRHQCRDCGAEFTNTHQLHQHAADTQHAALRKQYACTDCDKSFAHAYSLKRHRVEHGGDAHVCPTCGKRFAQLYELSRHLRSHHSDRPVAAVDYVCASSADSHECQQLDSTVHASTAALPSEPSTCFSVQIAKYMALQDAQTGLANRLLFHDSQLPKPRDVGLLAFAQSLVVSSAHEPHTRSHSAAVVSAATEQQLPL